MNPEYFLNKNSLIHEKKIRYRKFVQLTRGLKLFFQFQIRDNFKGVLILRAGKNFSGKMRMV